MAKFRCPVCGYIHEGDTAPEKCPLCGVPGSKFIQIEETEDKLVFVDEHVIGVAKDVKDPEILKGLHDHFNGECSEVGMYLAMSRQADREGYPEVADAFRRYAFEEADHAARIAELLGEVVWDTKTNLEKRMHAEAGACEGKKRIATLAKQQKEITSSIVYAKRIQFALMPDSSIFKDYFSDGFVFHVPKDVVSGDFWWTFHDEDYFILMCADCTGHGVPGAFMSMLGVSLLNEIVGRDRKRGAADILNCLRELIKRTVNQNMNDGAKLQAYKRASIFWRKHSVCLLQRRRGNRFPSHTQSDRPVSGGNSVSAAGNAFAKRRHDLFVFRRLLFAVWRSA